ncbi:hypothetical protein [Streptomyces sp. NPDC015345]|uniref:hypothetical protein n=1 Tax=Streptomyces sp. NPDC015345 TaxID=3364953 RepID=UPI0036F5D7C4
MAIEISDAVRECIGESNVEAILADPPEGSATCRVCSRPVPLQEETACLSAVALAPSTIDHGPIYASVWSHEACAGSAVLSFEEFEDEAGAPLPEQGKAEPLSDHEISYLVGGKKKSGFPLSSSGGAEGPFGGHRDGDGEMTLGGHSGRIRGLVAIPGSDGRALLVTSDQDTVRVWDATTGTLLGAEVHDSDIPVTGNQLTPVPLADGRTLLAIPHGRDLRLVDPLHIGRQHATVRRLRGARGNTLPGNSYASLELPDGSVRLISATSALSIGRAPFYRRSRCIQIWDPEKGRRITTLEKRWGKICPDETISDLRAFYWDAETPVLAFNKNGRLNIWSIDGTRHITTFQLPRIPNGRTVEPSHYAPVRATDGRGLLACIGHGVHGLWDLKAGRKQTGIAPPGLKRIVRVDAVRLGDHDVLAVAGQYEGAGDGVHIQLYDPFTARPLGKPFNEHQPRPGMHEDALWITTALSAPNGASRVASAGRQGAADGVVLITPPFTGQDPPRGSGTVMIWADGWSRGPWTARPVRAPSSVDVEAFLHQRPLPYAWPDDDDYRAFVSSREEPLVQSVSDWMEVFLHHPDAEVVMQGLRHPLLCACTETLAELLVSAEDAGVRETAVEALWGLGDTAVSCVFDALLARRGDIPFFGFRRPDAHPLPAHLVLDRLHAIDDAVERVRQACPADREPLLSNELRDDPHQPVRELITLGAGGGFLAQEAPVRAAGERLHARGGMGAMLAAHELVVRALPSKGRALEAAWDGIGNWLG